MKHLIDNLLAEIEQYQEKNNYSLGGSGIPSLCNKLQTALDAGELDCLEIRPASEPPSDNRPVLVRRQCMTPTVARWYSCDSWWLSDEGDDLIEVTGWWELPPVGEELK